MTKKRVNGPDSFMAGKDLDFLRHDAPDVHELLDKKITIALAIAGGGREQASRILGMGYRSFARLVQARRAPGHKMPDSKKPLARYA